MRGNHRPNITNIFLSCVFLMSSAQTLMGADQCTIPWDTYVTLNGRANGQVGLAVTHNKLVVTWGDRTTNQLKAAVFNGSTWTYPTLPSGPLVMSMWTFSSNKRKLISGGGVTMTASNACNAAYVAYVDAQAPGQYIHAAKYDGTSWTRATIYHIPYQVPQSLNPLTFTPSPPAPNYFWTAPPALFGDNTDPPPGYSTALPIGFAFPQYVGWTTQRVKDPSPEFNTYVYSMVPGQFDCNLGAVQVGNRIACHFWDPVTRNCADESHGGSSYEFDEGFKAGDKMAWPDNQEQLFGPFSPLWTGAVGPTGQMVELKALAQGNPLGNLNPPIWFAFGYPHWYSQNGDTINCLGTDCVNGSGQWTNNGIGGAVNPADGSAWFTYKCRYFNDDTCNTGSESIYMPYNLMRVSPSGQQSLCGTNPYGSAKTGSMPAMTFWKNAIWLAWQSTNENVVVASIPYWDLSWTSNPTLQRHSFSFAGGQGKLKWSTTTTGPIQCGQYPPPQGPSYTYWTDGAVGGFTYEDASGNNYPLGHINGAMYWTNTGCPTPTGPQPPGGIDLGPTGPNGNLMIHFTPQSAGGGYATIN